MTSSQDLVSSTQHCLPKAKNCHLPPSTPKHYPLYPQSLAYYTALHPYHPSRFGRGAHGPAKSHDPITRSEIWGTATLGCMQRGRWPGSHTGLSYPLHLGTLTAI